MVVWLLIIAAPFIYVAYESFKQVQRDTELDRAVADRYRDAA